MRIAILKKLIPSLALALGLTLAAGSAQAQMTKKTVIADPLRFVGTGSSLTAQVLIDNVNAGNETPQVSSSAMGTPVGTGFKWGGYFPWTLADALRGLGSNVGLTNPVGGPQTGVSMSYGIMLFYNHMGGQYEYTLFDSAGGNTPNQYVDLSGNYATASFYSVASAALANYPLKVRFMLRSNSNTQWYVSDLVTLPTVTATPVRIAILVSGPYATKWYAVNAPINSNLNLLAASDEVALAGGFAATPSTPDFSKVDGGGLFIDSGHTADAKMSAFKPTFPAWIADDAAAKPSLKITTKPSYVRDTTQLVLGQAGSSNPLSGAINIAASSIPPVNITNIALNDPSGRFSITGGTLGAQAVTATQTTTITVAWNPPPVTLTDENSSASLVLTCDAGGVPGAKVYLPIVGRLPKNVTIKESFNNNGSNVNMATFRPANQTPQVMNAPISGTGFKWGGYTNATLVGVGRHQVGMNGNRLTFYGGLADDANTGGNYKGCYAYTIFDSMSGTEPDYALKLEKIQILSDQAAAGEQIRFLIRDAAGLWYISNDAFGVYASTPEYMTFDLDGRTWKRVDAPAEAYMNTLGAVAQTPIADPATLAAAPGFSLNAVTGAGIYIETGETNPTQQTAFTIPDLNFVIRPANNDRATIKVKNTFTSNTALVPYKRLGLMAINCAVTSGMEVALDGLDVTVSNAAGLNTLYIYSDPNANGIPDDGTALTSCTVTGTNAKISFRSPQVVQKGIPMDYALVGLFDNTASSQTYTLTVQTSKWRQNTTFGGTGDLITQTPTPATATFKVNAVALPDILGNPNFTQFTETWEKVVVGLLASTPANGPVTDADFTWTYNFTGGSPVKMPAQFVKNNGSSNAGGVETKDMTSEVTPFDAGFFFRNDLPFAVQYDSRYIQMMKLDFTAVITSTTLSTKSPHYSARTTGDYSNFGIRLNSNASSNYTATFYPVTDFDRSFFAVNASGNTAEYAPASIPAYSSNNGLGRYQVSLWFAPTFGSTNLTTVKADIKHVESGKTTTWMTQINGSIPNVKSVDLWFSPWANAFFDDISLTAYQYFVNPVRSWTLFH